MKKLIAMLSLVLTLALCIGALAEQATAAQPAAAAQTETAAEQDATKQALDAYRALKKAARMKKLDALKQELDAYVADGKLTQEQADLVLKYYTEKLAAHAEKGVRKEQPGGKTQPKQSRQKPSAPSANGKGHKHNGAAANSETATKGE